MKECIRLVTSMDAMNYEQRNDKRQGANNKLQAIKVWVVVIECGTSNFASTGLATKGETTIKRITSLAILG